MAESSDPIEAQYLRPIVPEDEFQHAPEGDLGWRENWWLTFFDHRKQVSGVVYSNVLPGRERGLALVMLFFGDQLVYSLNDFNVPLAECDQGAGIVGPVRFTCVEPMQRWEVAVSEGPLSLRLDWEALHPAYDWDWGAQLRSRHYEQSVEVHGEIRLAGETVEISGWGQRDHAWGHRDPTVTKHAWSSRTFFDNGDIQHAAIFKAPEDDFLFGYTVRDGKRQLLDRIDLHFTPAYEGGPPVTTELRAWAGAELKLDQQVRLSGMVAKLAVTNGYATNQFFSFSKFCDGERSAVGQLDYWYVAPLEPGRRMTLEGNRGKWVTDE